MKRLVLALSICLTTFLAKAQQTKEMADFSAYCQVMNQKVVDASKIKDNEAGIRETNEWLAAYNKLSTEAKSNMMGFTASMYYNLACCYALEAKKDSAYFYLNASVKGGFSDFAHIQVDSDLKSLHDDAEFKSIVANLRDKYDYLHILQQSGSYNNSTPAIPAFTYQSSSAPELVALKNKYNLDSVAGNGDEISRIKGLLLWVHNKVKHDGNLGNPASKNAIDLIAVCKKENRGVNCRMMSTILRDVYQAEGFDARIVTCLPKDRNDNDCHVITVVWSKSLNKWIWMDPTFNAYVTDKKGNLLNIKEVRERMMSGSDDLVLNSDANWNNELKETQDQYLGYYMRKNLYWLQSPAKSEWDVETRKPGMAAINYVDLFPGTYSTISSAPKKAEGDTIEYATNNPDQFWAAPQDARP
jgi:hypothetical protein